MIDLSTFGLTNEPSEARSVFVAEVPAGLSSIQDLLKALQNSLKLPDYFGHNWDALDECLTDFWWLSAHTIIVLVHNDIPALSEQELVIYLDILSMSVKFWESDPTGKHIFLPVFPRKYFDDLAPFSSLGIKVSAD